MDEHLDMARAIAELEEALPGWWWSAGKCSISFDASCGPDRTGPDADLLKIRDFDEGFHHDGMSSVADSLRAVASLAINARNRERERLASATDTPPSSPR